LEVTTTFFFKSQFKSFHIILIDHNKGNFAGNLTKNGFIYLYYELKSMFE